MKIGAQLYTVRDYTKNLKDFSETLKRVAEIGYEYVQVSGTCDYEPEWLKSQLEKTGLKCVLTHRPNDEIINDTDKMIENHNIIGCELIGIGFYDFEKNTVSKFYESFKAPALKINQAEKKLMYHNHFNEFQKIDGKYLLDIIGEKLNSQELGFTFDTYWAQAAGSDAVYWLRKLDGRVPVIHLKDMNDRGKMESVGEGNMDFAAILKTASDSKTEFALVENDWPEIDPFESLRLSFKNIKALGF